MSRTTLSQWVQKLTRGRRKMHKTHKPRRTSTFERLGERINLSVNAVFAGGTLAVFGDNLDNSIEVSRDAAGALSVNGGAVKIYGKAPTVANTRSIQIFGLGGDDRLALNETNGALPSARLYGGDGNDTLIGGSAADYLFGQLGNDTLLGKGGADFLFGGAGNDVLTGGAGNDQVFGQAGNDRMIWNPGDGSDLNEGGAGSDTVEVNGGNGAENFSVNPNGTRVRFDRNDPAPFFIDIGTSEALVLNANGGDDVFTAANGLAALIALTVDGGAGDDTITGGDGNDRLLGGDGNDSINGGRGSDVVFLGAGDDTFVWNPGDGSDTVEGEDGNDTMVFNGANVGENFTLSANGGRLQFFRDPGNVTMDTAGIERVDVNPLGGADNIVINDLSGTDVTQVNLNLASVLDGKDGDNQPDLVTINGTSGDDVIGVSGSAGEVVVVGLATQINITAAEPKLDRLVINGLSGDDVIDASGLAADAIQLTASGGDGDDVLLGGDGDDLLNGNDGDDVLIGGPGVDILDGGLGDNILIQD